MFDEAVLEYRAKRTTAEKIAFAFLVSLGLVCLTLLGVCRTYEKSTARLGRWPKIS